MVTSSSRPIRVLPTVTFSSSTDLFCCLTLKAGFERRHKLHCGLTVGVISIHGSQIWAFVAEHCFSA